MGSKAYLHRICPHRSLPDNPDVLQSDLGNAYIQRSADGSHDRSLQHPPLLRICLEFHDQVSRDLHQLTLWLLVLQHTVSVRKEKAQPHDCNVVHHRCLYNRLGGLLCA